jgi:transaldolase
MTDRLRDLNDAGVAIWLDDLSRERLTSGSLQRFVDESYLKGVTSNPTIFAKALTDADEYASAVAELAKRGATLDEAVRKLTTDDVRDACDILRPVYDRTDGVDGRVSIEVDPRLALKTGETIDEAKELWRIVDRENLYIKIPATVEGLPAITATLAEGISVNVTLIFSIDRYRAVMDAFFAGVEQARDNGHDLSRLGSVASFFVSRVDTEVDKRLDAIGSAEAKDLRGKAAVANAHLAFEAYEQAFGTERWAALAAAGAKPQRPLWASTGTKDPTYSDTLYVDELVTDGVVNTMPEKTMNAFADHGTVAGDTVRGRYDEAREVIARLEALGISYTDVVNVLEEEGVDKFDTSWEELAATVTTALDKAAQG